MAVSVTMTQPAPVPQRFTEHDTTYQLDAAGPDPELKKLFPFAFASFAEHVEDQHDIPDNDSTSLLFIDNWENIVNKSDITQKKLPILADDLVGISSYFSRRHPGIDYRAKVGTPIRAILPGIVNEVGFEPGGYGRYIILVHHVEGKTLFSLYAHMKKTSVLTGTLVEAGDKIGEVGLTGHTTGPHLHFELHERATAIDPIRFFSDGNIALK